MAEKQKVCYENCSNCAYANQFENPLWCRFHDLPVSERNVCKEFYSLSDAGMYVFDETPPDNSLTKKDILAYVISCFNLAVAIVGSAILYFS